MGKKHENPKRAPVDNDQGLRLYRDRDTGRFLLKLKLFSTATGKEEWNWRTLDSVTVKAALQEAADKLNDLSASQRGRKVENPFVEAKVTATCGMLLDDYIEASCPMTSSNVIRKEKQLDQCLSFLKPLKPFFGDKVAEKLTEPDLQNYAAFRRTHEEHGVKAGCDGGCAIDHELGMLCTVIKWAKGTGRVASNPFADLILSGDFPTFRDKKKIKHCRDFMPHSADEFHGVARSFLAHPQSEVFMFQYLFEGMTGNRTVEVLLLRWDAPNKFSPGFIEERDGKRWLSVARAKGGVNPFVEIHPGLAALIDALKAWRVSRGLTDSPWFFPTCQGDHSTPVNKNSLGTLLTKLFKRMRKENKGAQKYTSHGARAYFVTCMRALGRNDDEIADMIGHKGGSDLIRTTYGSREGWQGDKKMRFLCDNPAWMDLQLDLSLASVIPLEKVA